MPTRWLIGVLLAASLAPVSAAAAGTHSLGSSRSSSIWQTADSRCGALARRPLAPYPWPVAPFHRQHAIRGYFGDPRTVIFSAHDGDFSFHNGVDIVAWPGNRVYPVVSGVVFDVEGDEVVVASSHARHFQYIHVRPRVREGEPVVASKTVLGTVFRPWNHVHLTELRRTCVVNPLTAGHLSPYRDTTSPRVLAISFRASTGTRLSPTALSGEITAVAAAQDEPAIPPPGPWRGMPVTPAVVGWRLATVRGRVLREGVAADFRYTEPPKQAFCTVYAPGTVQNFAAESGHFHWGRPGRYRFNLMPHGLDTRELDAGRYLFTVTAADTRGNTGSRSMTIRIIRERPRPSGTMLPDRRCRQRSLVDTGLISAASSRHARVRSLRRSRETTAGSGSSLSRRPALRLGRRRGRLDAQERG